MCLPNSFTFCPLACPAFMSWHQISLVSWLRHSIRNTGTAGKLPVGSRGGDEKEKGLASSCPVGQSNRSRGVPAAKWHAGVESPGNSQGGMSLLHRSISASLFTKGMKTISSCRDPEGKGSYCVPAPHVQCLEPMAEGENGLPKVVF